MSLDRLKRATEIEQIIVSSARYLDLPGDTTAAVPSALVAPRLHETTVKALISGCLPGAGRVPPTHTDVRHFSVLQIEKINDGFEKMKQGTSARSVVVFD